MQDLSSPLDDVELEWLEDFLINRIDETVDCDEQDVGVLGISELDGLLTAIVSGPITVHLSEWLPVIWGDFEPVFDDDEQFAMVAQLLLRHMNGISQLLMIEPEQFEPMFAERVVEGKTYVIVDEWCEGYMRGIALTQDAWMAAADDIRDWLMPIAAFTSGTQWVAHDGDEEQIAMTRSHIVPAVRSLHKFWLQWRSSLPLNEPITRAGEKIGRNAPCPCGSGKKYKKCCLH